MGLAVNLFHWTPDTFRHATPHEFWAAFEVYVELNKREED
jgi:hypothetical protein